MGVDRIISDVNYNTYNNNILKGIVDSDCSHIEPFVEPKDPKLDCIDLRQFIIPNENIIIENTAEKPLEIIANTISGVFWNVVPNLIFSVTFKFSPIGHVAITPLILYSCGSLIFIGIDLLCGGPTTKEDLKEGIYVWMLTACKILTFMPALLPYKITYRIAADSLLILTKTIESYDSIYDGVHQIASVWNGEKKSTSSKIISLISGSISIITGTMGFKSCFNKTIDTVLGFRKFQQLDSQQQMYVLKNQAISYLEKEKMHTAVIIDGMTNTDPSMPCPFSQDIYEHYETRVYSVENPEQLSKVLIDAKNQLGRNIDVLVLEGHADNQLMILGNDYTFTASKLEADCMNKVLSPEAQVFLIGCNTATPASYPSLTEKLSKNLPGVEVNGYAAYYCPQITTTSYRNGRIQHDNHVFKSEVGLVNPLSTRVTIKTDYSQHKNVQTRVYE